MSAVARDAAAATTGEGALAIVCGGGSLPFALADAVAKRGRRAVLFALRGYADPTAVERYPHRWIALGQFGRFRRLLTTEGCREVVWLGTLVRPSVGMIRLDWTTLRLLPRIVRALRGGDDHLLSGIAAIFADHGIRLVAAHEVAPELLVPAGPLGARRPSEADQADIERGTGLLGAIGRFDVGQGVVVAQGHVLAVEGVEGTDLMLARVAELRANGRLRAPSGAGVLVKAPKAGQDRRFDLPAIGAATVEAAAKAGLAGIAVTAGATLVAEPDKLVAAADRFGLFVVGLPEPGGRTP
jgi:UDP-2,3-diacylglucosamine hydrolase